MNPIHPDIPTDAKGGLKKITFGRGQPEYIELPAFVDGQGTITTEWEFTAEELEVILNGGKLRLTQLYTPIHQGIRYSPVRMEIIPPR